MIRCVVNAYIHTNVVTGLAGSVFGGGAGDVIGVSLSPKYDSLAVRC